MTKSLKEVQKQISAETNYLRGLMSHEGKFYNRALAHKYRSKKKNELD